MRHASLALLVLVAGCGREEGPAEAAPPATATAPAPAAIAPGVLSVGGLKLGVPIDCRLGETCEVQNHVDRDPGPLARDYRCQGRTYEGHNGVDIRLPDMAAQRAGVNVLAAAAGRVSRMRDGVADISVRAPGAPPVAGAECGNGIVIDHGEGWETQYCHLAQGSLLVKAGEAVAAGQPIARVGLSGNTEYPHLHMSVRRAAVVVDPFAPEPGEGTCLARGALWTEAAYRALAYKEGAVLNVGFASAPVTQQALEDAAVAPAHSGGEALVAYARAISLKGGDVLTLKLTGPDGTVLADGRMEPLDRDKAQYMMFVGKKRPGGGWPAGVYRARFEVLRNGAVVLGRSFEQSL